MTLNGKIRTIPNKVKLTANVFFSGIGAQERGFENSGLFDIDVLTTSDIDKEAVVSYAAVHCGLTPQMIEEYENYPSREEMAEYLTNINLGYKPEKNKKEDWHRVARRKKKDIEKYWLACKLSNNKGDISKIEDVPYADLWTISFPCTDISVAGKMKGLNPDSSTRSSLLWENIRLLKKAVDDHKSPKYIMFENVKNLVGKKFIDDFNSLIEVLEELGYNTYWKVINGKDCGIPQNRERVFAFAIRKDIDTGKMDFPIPFDNGIRLKDTLEDSVDEKYYLSEEVQKRFKLTDLTLKKDIIGTTKPPQRTIGQRDLVYQQDAIMGALVATDYKQPKQIIDKIGIDKSINDTKIIDRANCLTAREDRGVSNRKGEGTAVVVNNHILNQVGQIYGTQTEPNPQAGRIYDAEYISPTLDSCSGGNRMPKILQRPRGNNHGGEHMDCTTISSHAWEQNNVLLEQFLEHARIRKLTPTECWRLMGFEDKDIDNAIAVGVADSQLYKQAGNSIITNCVELLAEHLYKAQYDSDYICFDENFIKPQTEFNFPSVVITNIYLKQPLFA